MMKRYQKFVIGFIACICILPAMTTNAATGTIKDVKDTHWASKTIHTYVDNGYMDLSNGYFYPNRAITRGEVATVLVKAQKLKLDATISLNATDITIEDSRYKAFQKLVELGIFANSTTLKPDATLTRAQMAKVIALTFGIEVDNVNKKSFKDYAKTFWAKDFIESLADENIIQGKTATKFAPNDSVTKAQFISLVSRAKSFQSKVNTLLCAYDLRSHTYVDTKPSYPKEVTAVIALVNEERKKVGLSPVVEDKQLSQLATVKVNDMIKRNYFEHESPYYGMVWDMANYFDYEFRSLGENLAKNLTTPATVMKGWMTSDKHKENILKTNYTNIGVAMKKDSKGNVYWVQLFSSK